MIKSLIDIDRQLIVDCLHHSFSDYALPMKATTEYWLSRWDAARIDYDLSYGYFYENKFAGFILHGIDIVENKEAFFNMGTGVIPEFRGNRIVKQVYEYCLPILRQKGIEEGYLEVLCDNEKAIKAYQSTGFSISNKLFCYSGLPLEKTHIYQGSIASQVEIEKYKALSQLHLSWEQTDQTIIFDPSMFTAIELKHGDTLVAFAIIKTSNQNLTQFGVLDQDWGKYGKALFSEVYQHFEKYKLINIDERDEGVNSYLIKNKFPGLLNQYEMKILL